MPRGIPNNPTVKRKNGGFAKFNKKVKAILKANPGMKRPEAMTLASANRKGGNGGNNGDITLSPLTGEITPQGVAEMVTKRRCVLMNEIETRQNELNEWNKVVTVQARDE